MSEEKKEAQKALLGELESIKSLLSEDEWDEIPVLSDPISAPGSEHHQASTPKDGPAEDDTQAAPQAENETSDIDAAVDKLNFDLNLDTDDDYSADASDEIDTESDDYDEMFDDVPLLEEVYIPEDDSVSPAVSGEAESAPLSEVPADEDLTDEGIEQSFADETSYASEESLDREEPSADEEPLAYEEPLACEEPSAHEEPSAIKEPSTNEAPETLGKPPTDEKPLAAEESLASEVSSVSEEPADTETLSAEEEPPALLEETTLPPGVLPGQRSLFDNKPATVKTPDQPAAKPTIRPAVQTRGENPFLPQHIRERLHTNKALLDIIKESPLPEVTIPPRPARYTSEPAKSQNTPKEKLPPVLPPEKLHQMVEGIIAVYLPKIEAELRQRLLEALQDDKPKNQ